MNEYRWADLALGTSARFEAVITEESMRRFAQISGDVNPLHLDDEFARSRGFPARLAFGLLTSSFYSTLVGVYLPGRWALLHGLDIDLKAPAYVGERLTIAGEITHMTDAYRRIDLKASIVNSQGKTVSKATIRVGIHEP
jgi:3-hydroxybutyryl-CoA dehydratase